MKDILPIPIVQTEREQVNEAIPDPSDWRGTLRYWDTYRARERTRITRLRLKLDADGVPLPGQSVTDHFKIDEFPTELNLAKKAEQERQERINQGIVPKKPARGSLWTNAKKLLGMSSS